MAAQMIFGTTLEIEAIEKLPWSDRAARPFTSFAATQQYVRSRGQTGSARRTLEMT